MPQKHIILIHGRAIKPSRKTMIDLSRRAIRSGLARAGRGAADAIFESDKLKFSFCYFGDISNGILAEKSNTEAAKLTETDPESGRKCFPAKPLQDAFALTDRLKTFDKRTYTELLKNADDLRMLDDASDMVSLIGSLFTGGILNKWAIDKATADLGAYLTSHTIGSDVRARLGEILAPAIEAGDDICLVAHSMGCMISYDVLWKYAHTSEYAGLRNKQNPLSLWLTIGNPLGEDGVRRNLLDGRYVEAEKYPLHLVREWANFYAQDDFVAHVEKIAPIYRKMPAAGRPRTITDTQIYNCWHYEDVNHARLTSNPHDLYGYLMHQAVAGRLADWLEAG
jgi:hypothetical protein